MIKVNVDAGFDEHTKSGSTGLVMRNHAGALTRAQALWYERAADSRTMEAIAIRDGIRLAHDLRLTHIAMESDALEVVNIFNSSAYDKADIGAVCREIRELSGVFASFALSHVPREANEAAHRCAKQASSTWRSCLWINFVSSFLQDCTHHPCKLVD